MVEVKIFLLAGKAEAGKDSFYHIAEDLLGKDTCKRFAFGDEVKAVAKRLTWDGKKDEKGRTLLQWLGDGARKYNNDVWLDLTREKLNSFFMNTPGAYNIFFTDCRYPNEILKIKEWGNKNPFSDDIKFKVYSVCINREGHSNALTAEQRKNTSEVALDDFSFDAVVANRASDYTYYKNNIKEFLRSVGCTILGGE